MAELLAGILVGEPVPVAEAAAVDERQAPLRIPVEEPLVVLAVARALVLAQEADGGGSRGDANVLAVGLLFEVVAPGLAASVPEPAAASVLEVVVPLGFVVGAGSSLGRLGTSVPRVGGSATL